MPEPDRAAATADDARHQLVGESAAMAEVRRQIERVAPTDARVLVTGETGTGKELVAYWLHRRSRRHERAYVKVNCAAIPPGLLESELFGHVRGAFTGAVEARPGRFEQADQGTLLLDEIGDMEQLLQAKLLRVLESGEFEPLGSSRRKKVDVRIVSATNHNLREEVTLGRFREDLFHRLNVFTIHVPALRERPEDIPVLARYFLAGCCAECGMAAKRFAPEAERSLGQRDFPGNVRELRNVVERAAIVAPAAEITPEDLAGSAVEGSGPDPGIFSRTRPLAQARDELERRYLQTQLARFGWDLAAAARQLKLGRSRLQRRLEQLGISVPEARSGGAA